MANLRIEESPLARHVQGEHVMPSIMSCRQAAELDHAFERCGWSPQEVKLLSSGNLLTEVRKVVLGYASISISMSAHIIDCNAKPFVPDGWKVEEHKRDGKFKFYPSLMQLFLTEDQQNSTWVEPRKLRKELVGKPVLNANVLEFLLAHTELIPEEWKSKEVFFWGTIYRPSEDQEGFPPHLYVGFLDWRDDKWRRSFKWIGDLWLGIGTPAALRIV